MIAAETSSVFVGWDFLCNNPPSRVAYAYPGDPAAVNVDPRCCVYLDWKCKFAGRQINEQSDLVGRGSKEFPGMLTLEKRSLVQKTGAIRGVQLALPTRRS